VFRAADGGLRAMIESTHGIICRTRRFTETSLIVNWLTPDLGRLSTIAKGALRPKSPFRGKLDLFYEVDFSFARSRRSELHTLREVSLTGTHTALRCELRYLQQASYCAGLVEQVTEKETALPAIYELMRGLLEALPLTPPRPQTVLAFELKLLEELGLKPDLRGSRLTAGAKQVATALAGNDWRAITHLKPSAAQTAELQQFLHGFLVYNVGRIPNSRSAALVG
jgi:DNA repair protein RecO (recombination protein O)